VYFEQATGTAQSKNLAEYYGAGEDAIYLSGIAAGAATKSGVVGYVVPFAIPEVIRHTNAFALGVQTAHPGAKVRIVWTNSWFAPDKEKKAAESLKAAGADVIGQNVDSPAAGQYAESASVPWVGYDSNAQKFAPKQWLTGAVYNWGPYYLQEVKAAMNGTWKSHFYYGTLKQGFAKLAPYGPKVSAST
jgi:basic membrane protein A